MPKLTFYNLPKEKQETLLDSLKKEFSRVPLFEASIANIVRDANIPRGSFYQYFEDKEDAFYYLLEQLTKANEEKFILLLKQSDGDIFETFVATFKIVLTEFNDQANRLFFKNTLLNMNYKTESIIADMFSKSKIKEKFSLFDDLINKEHLNIKDDNEIVQIMTIIVVLTVHHLMRNFANETTFEEAVYNYKLAIDMLKRGLIVSN